jgi:DNA-binding winged helix-turn-helix (wHTH) protein
MCCQHDLQAVALPETSVKFREGNVKAQTTRYRLDDLIIDTGTRQVTRDGVDLAVTGLSFDLLLAMGDVAPNLLSVDAIIERVWPGQIVSTETLTQRVKLLRQLLGDSAASPRYIASRRGHGYRLMSKMVPLPGEVSRASRDSQAHELYLQARVVMRGTHESRDRALMLLDQALSRDPDFAPALAYRALLHAGSVALSGAPASRSIGAEQDAIRALASDPDLADAHVARAWILADRHCWLEAETHFAAALSLDPADPFVRNLYALSILRPTGRLDRARVELAESYRLAPAVGFTAHELALTHSLLGDDTEAARFADLTQALSGIGQPHWDLMLVHARAYARKSRFSEAAMHAVKALPEVLRREGADEVVDAFYSGLADASQRSRACAALASFVPRLESIGVDGRTRAFFVTAYAMLGELDLAYDLMDRFLRVSADAPLSVELSDLWLPELRLFRADHRFEHLVQRLQLPTYWQQHGPADGWPAQSAAKLRGGL